MSNFQNPKAPTGGSSASQMIFKGTLQRGKQHLYSITSSARSSREVDRRVQVGAFCRGIEPTRLSCAV
jgi:hypothetical protein